jgi:diguanylate cyclase (GGDEF)-like protein
MFDVDDFKKLNDRFGHAFGDRALMQVADVLRRCAADRNFIAGRQGGDEFAMVLADTDRAEAFAIAQAIRAACAEATPDAIAVCVSIGIAVSARSKASLPALLRRADIALYDAKRTGGGRAFAGDANERWPSVA